MGNYTPNPSMTQPAHLPPLIVATKTCLIIYNYRSRWHFNWKTKSNLVVHVSFMNSNKENRPKEPTIAHSQFKKKKKKKSQKKPQMCFCEMVMWWNRPASPPHSNFSLFPITFLIICFKNCGSCFLIFK